MFLAELRPEEQKAFLELAHLMATVDGSITMKEDLLLEEYQLEMGLEDYQIKRISMEEILASFQSERSKKIALAEILRLIFTDGIYHEHERESIRLMKQHFGFDADHFDSYKDWINKIKELSVIR